jgi:glutaconate CoA-transferase subunit B
VFARDLQDGEMVMSGAHTEISFGSIMLAQKLHAPNLMVDLAANCFWCNVSDREAEIYPSSSDYRNVRFAEARFDHPDIFYYLKFVDKFFVGGIQVDKFGNTNLIGVGQDPKRLRFRGPGSVGIADIAAIVKNVYIFVRRHDLRTVVDRVDYISYPGFVDGPGSRERLGFVGNGPRWLVTPLAVFDFHPETKQARLARVMPGVSRETVRSRTGFTFEVAPDLAEVPPPTAEELRILRSVDKRGLLRRDGS